MALTRTQIDAICAKIQGSRDLSSGGILALKEVLNALNDGVIEDAPSDSQQYAREDGGWTVVSGGGGGLSDAPSDGTAYGREDATWVNVVEEAPNDGQSYVRKALAWGVAVSGSGLSHPETMARIGFGGF